MMGDEINIESIEVVNNDAYQIDLKNERTNLLIRTFIRRDALFALIAVAEEEHIHRSRTK
jgi:hypothetical protein